MKIATTVGYWSSGPPGDAAQLFTTADELGLDQVWTAEAYGSDAWTPLAWWGSRTSHVKLGTAISQLSARPPATLAMAAMTMDHLTQGRVLLGVGTSNPQVVEGWYGQPYPRPLERTREYAITSAAPALRDALLAATSSDTVRSRIYSGKPARLLRNRWTKAWTEPGAPEPLPMPLQNLLVSEAHQRLMRSGKPDVVPMPVGQIVGRMNEVHSVAEVMAALVAETGEALSRLDGLR